MSLNKIKNSIKNFGKNNSNINNLRNIFSEKFQKIFNKNSENSEKNILTELTELEKQNIQKNLDETARNILNSKKELFPTHKAKIDDFEFYFSPKINRESKQLFFVLKNSKIEPRVARFSQSGGKMQIFPGYDSNPNYFKRYSKGDTTWGFDYESGVVADRRIEKILQNLPNEITSVLQFGDRLAGSGYTTDNYETLENLKEFEKISVFENGKGISLNDLKNIYKNSPEDERKDWYRKNPKLGMKNIFDNAKLNSEIFEKFLKNNKEFEEGTKFRKISSKKDEIAKYDFEVGEFDGKMIFATICYKKEEKELCWIENFSLENSPITSFGIPKHRISSEIFTTKPTEYVGQVPENIVNEIKEKGSPEAFYDDYVDIREYLQDNPFIIAFKKIREKKPELFD